MRVRRFSRHCATGLALLALSACVTAKAPPQTNPQARPADVAMPAAPVSAGPSRASQAMTRYYSAVQADLLAQGLLRTDGGGPDSPYTDTDVIRNFERIAFYDEYERNAGLRSSRGGPVGLRKWTSPVRITLEFGDSVPKAQRPVDRGMVSDYAKRLAQVTGHPISTVRSNPNFHVLIMGEDDRAQAVDRIRQIVPNINSSSIALFRTLPRSIHCLVVAFSSSENDHSYGRAIAFIRAEHPKLMRQSCVHEELAQGLGLANDSPHARPSIFNDDDEFALLTAHDEELLSLLYTPDLKPGMYPDEALPIARRILTGTDGSI